MNRRLLIIAGSVAAVLVAAFATWWFVLKSDAPPPVALDDAVAAATSSTVAGQTSADDTTVATEATPTDIEGTWSLSSAGDSFAGYRVAEELANIGFTEAAGRTPDVEATLVVTDGTVTGVDVTVDMRTLESDDSRRDGRLRTQAIETDMFPTSTFTLTEPITLPEGAATGEAFQATGVGDLTVHGVTRRVEVALEAQLVDGIIAVVGSTEIVFDDYAIEKPTSMAVLSIEDKGVMEFQLLFEQR